MAKPEWGQKRQCLSCGCRFYDMNRTPILCPKCGATVEPDQPIRTRRGSSSSAAEKAAATAVASKAVLNDDLELAAADEADIDLDVEAEADADDDTLIEDTSDLGEDDDDMAEVIEHMDSDRHEEG